VLCFIGGLAGLLVGMEGVRLLLKMRPDTLARIGSVQVNWTVLGFVTGISLLSGVLFGLAPALETRKVNLIETLKEAGRTSVGRARASTRALLVIAEVALGFVLLAGAGLMMRTMDYLHKVDPGFKPDGVLTFEISLSGREYN